MAQRTDIGSMLVEVLLERVTEDPFPSPTHMDMIEELMDDDAKQRYVEILLDRVYNDRFPSVPMLARIKRLT